LSGLSNLEELDLQSNPITTIPEWICDFPKMEIQWKNTLFQNDIKFH